MKSLTFLIRGPGKWTPACESPNPPWFCDQDAPAVTIDNHLILLFIAGLLLATYFYSKHNGKRINK